MDDADLAGEVVARPEAEALARARRLPPCCADLADPPCPQHRQAGPPWRRSTFRSRGAAPGTVGDQ